MKRAFTDQMNRTVEISFPPKRIISLVPSQTELLYDLGLKDEVVGQTLFCIHPPDMHQVKPRVGGTKKVQFDKIARLVPDLIIANKEENEQLQMEELMRHYPVWMSDIRSLEDALDMIRRIGELVNKEAAAALLVDKIMRNFAALNAGEHTCTVAYLIWRDPYMVAGHDTFINDMLKRCGWQNVFEKEEARYPEITAEVLARSAPALILLSSEPYPFQDKHMQELQAICPSATVRLVDGELFSWYGSRLVKSIEYFNDLLREIPK
jgi:ABC-type Fe3+-hydroxamate transport system substrate-binding protein